MAVFCITTSNPEFQKLLAESGEKQGVFAMMVSKWMTENEVYDRYPTLQELGISPITSVKPGVPELFDSNPELANGVYETLGFVRSDKVLSENYENYFSEIQDMNSAIFDNLENADLLYTHYEIKELDINSLDLSKKTAGYSDNASDYLKDTLKSVKDQKTPILINGRGEVVEGWHRIHSLKANDIKTVKAYVPITPQQKQQAQQLYSQYLNTITNEVIVYKGLRDKSTKVHDTPNHSYFTPNRVIADKWYKDERGVKTFVIPKVASVEYKSDFSQGISKVRKDEETFINTAKEPLIKLNTIDIGAKQVQYVLNKNITALELGSKQDLEGFKSFVGNVGDVATDTGLDMSNAEAKAFNSLVNDGTISIKCE